MVWLDETHGPTQAALARYIDDDKTHESTWDCGPFDSAVDVVVDALRTLDRQLTLW